MTEFEVQQLLVATRWEFDVPTFFFVLVSMGFMAVGVFRPAALTALNVRFLQIAYALISGFMLLRCAAAIVRLKKLSVMLLEMDPTFEYWNRSLQMPTLYARIALFLVVFLLTLFLLNTARRGRTVQ